MRLSIATKLILVIGLLSLVTLTAMFLLTRVRFQVDFVAYINEQSEQRLESIASLAGPFYEANGSWELLRRNPRLWRQLLAASDVVLRAEQPRSEPPLELVPPPSSIALLDLQREFVAGEERMTGRGGSWLERPVIAGGEVVGYLVAPRRTQAIERIDQQFATRQLRSGYVIALVVLVVVLVITALAAQRMVRPILQIKQGTRRLTGGDYAARVELNNRDELGELAENFNQLAETLERNRTSQRRWFSNISHELRTPIAILRGEIETLQAGIKPTNSESLESLQEEVDRIARLVEDLHLLALSDAQEITYYYEPCDLRELVGQVVEESRDRVELARVTIDWTPPARRCPVRVDAQRLKQVLLNLIENGIRYAGSGSRLRFSCQLDGAQVRLVVEDDGPGVAPDDLPHLFDRLYRAEHSRNRRTGGSGLGLSICRGIVEGMGGRIEAVHSALGGLAICITLPAYRETGDRHD